MQFNEQLASLRRARNISQEALAEQLGVSRQAVSKWETGTSQPELGNILALCRILKVSPNELLGDSTQSDANPATDSPSPSPSLLAELKEHNTTTNTSQKKFLRDILIWAACIILLIMLGLSLQNSMESGSAPKIASCYIHETRALDDAREFTIQIVYSRMPEDQTYEVDLQVRSYSADNIYKTHFDVQIKDRVGYVTFWLPYNATCTVNHISNAWAMSHQQSILKITKCRPDTYDQELLVK